MQSGLIKESSELLSGASYWSGGSWALFFVLVILAVAFGVVYFLREHSQNSEEKIERLTEKVADVVANNTNATNNLIGVINKFDSKLDNIHEDVKDIKRSVIK